MVTKRVCVDAKNACKKVKAYEGEDYPIWSYTHIIYNSDTDEYGELRCNECDSNVIPVQGRRTRDSTKKYTFFKGNKGLRYHLQQAHPGANGDDPWDTFIFKNCFIPISDERFDELKVDHKGDMIKMKSCKPAGVSTTPGNAGKGKRQVAAKNLKKGQDIGTYERGDDGDDDGVGEEVEDEEDQ